MSALIWAWSSATVTAPAIGTKAPKATVAPTASPAIFAILIFDIVNFSNCAGTSPILINFAGKHLAGTNLPGTVKPFQASSDANASKLSINVAPLDYKG